MRGSRLHLRVEIYVVDNKCVVDRIRHEYQNIYQDIVINVTLYNKYLFRLLRVFYNVVNIQ